MDSHNKQKLLEGDDEVVWAGFYALMAIVVSVLFFFQFSTGEEVGLSLSFIFLSLVILTLKRWTGAFLIMFSQASLLLMETPNSYQQTTEFGPLWVLLPLGLLLAASRYRLLQERNAIPIAKSVSKLTSIVTDVNVSATVSKNAAAAFWHTLRTGAVIFLCGTAAWFLMLFVPVGKSTVGLSSLREFSLQPSGYRLLMLGLSFFAAYLVIWIFVSWLAWRRITPSQASVFLRSVFVNYYHRDLRMFILKRMKLRKARTRTASPALPLETQTGLPGDI
ncbi:MAG: hypothetical protein WAO83_21150 [Fuerstiella sp.]